jgi:signal transduction histidine kinase
MEHERLVTVDLGPLNRGLLVFRLGLYVAVAYGLLQRDPTVDGWLVVSLVVTTAFIPALPNLTKRIEIGILSTLVLELLLTQIYGPFPALQIMAMFSVAVAGLFLSQRVAVATIGFAALLQLTTMASFVVGTLPAGADLPDLLAELLLILASGFGFIGIGAILRQYQRQLVDSAREELRLTEMIESKDRLIDSIAHEIRTPVTAVLGLSSELNSTLFLSAEEVAEIAHLVATESRKLAHLVDNLVMRERADIARLALRVEDLDLSNVLRAAWRVLGLKTSQLVIEGESNVRGDRGRLQHIFVNLFDNCVRHGALPVTVRVEEIADRTQARISDAGPGFGMVQSSTVEGHNGLRDVNRPDHVGLGLPVSRMLAQQMDGSLSIEDGSIVVTLPAADALAKA